MAERRMFSKSVIDSDAFLDMPITSQLLYFHLSMRADDDGFVDKPKTIMRLCGCKDDDIKILIAKHFIIPFESGIVVIRHWKVHNYIPKDRYKPTIYNTEKQLLKIETNGMYCIQTVSNMDTQVRLGEVKLGEVRLEENRLSQDNIERKNIKKEIPTEPEALKEFGLPTDFNDLKNRALDAVKNIREV